MIAGAMSAWTRAPSLVVVASMLCASCAWQPRDATTYAAKGREAAAQGRSTAATAAAEIAAVALAVELVTGIAYLLWIPLVGFGVWLVIWRVGFKAMENA